MKILKFGAKALALTLSLLITFNVSAKKNEDGPIPMTHLMPCCRTNNAGTKFLVNGEWNGDHDYSDINQVRDIMQKVKDAGINIVSIDFTNPSQWNTGDVKGEPLLWTMFEPMLLNVEKVCEEKDMQFVIFIGNPDAWTMKYWNEKAKMIWERWAQKPTYRKYGFGDKRPMLIVFYPGENLEKQLARTPENEKNYIEKFHLGTCEVNQRILPKPTDGWGYRNFSQSSDGKVRFVAPNGGVPPEDWFRVDAKEWKRRVEWAKDATEYSVFGSYDDVCDGIFWGIADVSESKRAYHRNKTTENDPFVYYNILKESLLGK